MCARVCARERECVILKALKYSFIFSKHLIVATVVVYPETILGTLSVSGYHAQTFIELLLLGDARKPEYTEDLTCLTFRFSG